MKRIIAIFLLLVATTFGSLCYQETATSAPACGGYSTGSYTCSGSWHASYPCANTYDANWGTYGTATASATSYGYNIVKYTKAANSTNLIWEVKDTNGQANLTIQNTSACWTWNSTIVQFNITSKYGSNAANRQTYWSCWNGTAYVQLRASGNSGQNAYEEGVYWNVTDSVTITTMIGSATSWIWGTPTPGVSVVPHGTGATSWTWGVYTPASGNKVINGSKTSWSWVTE